MVKVGLIGLGGMGRMHYGCLARIEKAQVVALSDIQPDRLKGEWDQIDLNLETQEAGHADLSAIKRYRNASRLIADPEVDAVLITLPTHLHARYAIRALRAGKHVFTEKPIARTLRQADQMIEAAEQSGRILMVGHCVRFDSPYVAARDIILGGTHGRVIAANFWRAGGVPKWSWDGWMEDPKRSGGAVIDLHIHDADYIHYLFGRPAALFARGTVSGPDAIHTTHVAVTFTYPDGPVVTAEASWAAVGEFGFRTGFTVLMERATLVSAPEQPLMLYPEGRPAEEVALSPGDPYTNEDAYFLDCVTNGRPAAVVPPEDARTALEICLAELRSMRTGRIVKVT